METIKISMKGFWFKYWSFLSFDHPDRPITTCDLRWELMWKTFLMLVTLPAFIWFLILGKFSETSKTALADDSFGYTLIFALELISFLLFAGIFKSPVGIAYLLGPTTLIAFAIGLLCFMFIGWGIALLISKGVAKVFPRKTVIAKGPSLVTILYRGWKDKLCSKIEYI